MINELIIILSDKQQAELIKRSLAADNDDDHNYLQSHINEWLKPERDREHSEK